jgi:hypothetical protein
VIDAIGDRHAQAEGEHGDEMHGPDAAAERECGADQPRGAPAAAGGIDARSKVQGSVGGKDGDRDRQGDQGRIVGSVKHARWNRVA